MTRLSLNPNSKPIRQYFEMVSEKRQMGLVTEGNVAPAFADLLGYCARQAGYTFNEQHPLKLPNNRSIRLDGAVLTRFNLRYGAWEAKDSQDDLRAEIRRKFEAGYPRDNILFQSPDQAILFQDGREVLAADLDAERPQALVNILQAFFSYTKPAIEEWEQAVAAFKDRVPEVAKSLDALIEREYSRSLAYKQAFDRFFDLCRSAINPNLSKDAVEEMLIQHILTERIFRRVFHNERFTRQNAIAREIETVVDALTGKYFNRDDFMRELDHFYGAIETTAATIGDYNEKQNFLNTVYEQFFQGFSVKVADTHGIVYTPQPIVQFMVRSVEDLLRREFNRSLADPGVHILDPFVGTGNFILRVMEEIRRSKPSALPHKYAHELHCNEVMLLPYYIASMNIEHAYYEAMGEYAPFEGICLVDTFDLAENRQMSLFTEANTQRVERQRRAELTVILGNPPYNAGQVNENDNNKNRAYAVLDRRVQETYSHAGTATLRNALSDPYVKAFRWASDRVADEGIVAFVSNNGFLDGIAFDGMRYWLGREFSAIYHLDFKGNARTSGERRRKEGGNIFSDLIRVGVGITFLVRRKDHDPDIPARVYLYQMDDYLKAGQKLAVIEDKTLAQIPLRLLTPDENNIWLTEGLQTDWDALLPLGTKDAKAGRGQAIFETYSSGVKTNRDSVVYSFQKDVLAQRMREFVDDYNSEVDRYKRAGRPKDIDNFVKLHIKWDGSLKERMQGLRYGEFSETYLRSSLYRPFTKQHLYFDWLFINRTYQFPRIFPTPETERENRVICVSGVGSSKPFMALMTNFIPCVDLLEKTQCFPLYTYEPHPPAPSPYGEGESAARAYARRDNISDWALAQYREHYGDASITKEDIFYHLYALLHHPAYRQRYAANLKRELPRVPFVTVSSHQSAVSSQETADGAQPETGDLGLTTNDLGLTTNDLGLTTWD